MSDSAVPRALAELGCLRLVVATIEEPFKLTEFGDRSVAVHLHGSLFGDKEAIEGVLRVCEAGIQPKSWVQGEFACVVVATEDSRLLGLYCRVGTESAQHRFRAQRRLAQEALAYLQAPPLRAQSGRNVNESNQEVEYRKYQRIKAELVSVDERRLPRSEEGLRKTVRSGNLHDASVALSLLSAATLSQAISGFANGRNTWPEMRLYASQGWWGIHASSGGGIGEKFGHLLSVLVIAGEDRRVLESLEWAERDMSRASHFTCFAVRAAELMLGAGDRFKNVDQTEPYASVLRGVASGRVEEEEILSAISHQLSESFLDDPDDSRFLEFDGSIVLLPLTALLTRKAVAMKGGEWPAISHPMLSGPQWDEEPSAAVETESETLSAFIELAEAKGIHVVGEGT